MSQVTYFSAEFRGLPSENFLNVCEIFRGTSVPCPQTGRENVLQNTFLGRQHHVKEGYAHSLS